MAFYDVNANLQYANPLQALAQGRALGLQAQEQRRQEEIRNSLMKFMQPATPDRTVMAPDFNARGGTFDDFLAGPKLTPQTVPGQKGGYDYEGAQNYLMSMGAIDQAGSLAKLREMTQPQKAEYGLNPQVGINPQTGEPEFFVTDKRGAPKFLGVAERVKPTFVGGWRISPDGVPEAALPETPAQRRQAAMEAERLRLVQEESAARRLAQQQEREAKGTKTEQEKASKFKSVNDLDSTLSAYEAELKGATRADLANPFSEKAVRLSNLATQVQMAYKNAAELGAITGPDWAIINSIVASPTGAKAALYGPEKLLTQLDEVKKLSARQRQQLNQIYGAQPGGDWSGSTGKGQQVPANGNGWGIRRLP